MADLTAADEKADREAEMRQAREEAQRRYRKLRYDAHAVWRAVEGWQTVKSEEDWLKVCEDSRVEYQSGRFLIERLGADRYLDPSLMATLWSLRQTVLAEGGSTAADAMLVDLAVLNYSNALRMQGLIGNLTMLVEHEFFAQPSLRAKFEKEYGRGMGLIVEDHVKRLAEQLMPLFERANRGVIRNLQARNELRQGLAPAVAIGRAKQVNLVERQRNPVIQGSDRTPCNGAPRAKRLEPRKAGKA